MSAYYKFINREQQADGSCVAHYQPTKHAQGAWNEHEQHMAPATGLLTVELEKFVPQANMRVARISLDILGLIPLDEFTVTTRCIRPGKTIELIEAVMSSRGRNCIIARAWRLMTQDTSAVAGLEDQKALHQPDELPVWGDMKGWPGGFIESVRLVAAPERRPGKGMVWITNDIE
ncbi:acyl-CoA thioesterase domain-containing protein, partial [Psychrobacter sp. 1U2]